MNKELIIMLMLTSNGFLFAFGGWKQKYWRRFVMPVVCGVLLHLYGAELWRVVGSMLTLSFATHLGYGENKNHYLRVVTACSFSLPSLWFGLTIWQVILPVNFIVYFYLSNWRVTANDFKWKIVEFMTGVMIAISIIAVI